MHQRVECQRCKAHRDLLLAPRCLVCRYESWNPVTPTSGDRDLAVDAVVEAAEEVDLVLYDFHSISEMHPSAMALREACRVLALSRTQQ